MDRQAQIRENLEHCRAEWESTGDLLALYQAVSWCRSYPMPNWLVDALKRHLHDVMTSPQEAQRRVREQTVTRMVMAVRDAIHGDRPYPFFWREVDEKPSEEHFRIACDRLNAEGLSCTPSSVKKTWQRYTPLTYSESLNIILEPDPDEDE